YDVEPTERRAGLRHQTLRITRAADIGGDEARLRRALRRGGGRARRRVNIGDHNARALRDEAPRHSEPDPTGPTVNDRNLVLEFHPDLAGCQRLAWPRVFADCPPKCRLCWSIMLASNA